MRDDGLKWSAPPDKKSLRELLANFLILYSDGWGGAKDNMSIMIKNIQAEIDRRIEDQMNEILHHDTFQQIDATWKSIHFLTANSPQADNIKFKVLNASKKALKKDFDRSVDFDQSVLFKLVYEGEFGTMGGQPYSVLIGDYQFDRLPQDIALLSDIAKVCSAAHTMFLSAPSPKLLDLNSFEELGGPRKISRIFRGVAMSKWRAFRRTPEARYVCLVLPRILLRLPYGWKKHRINPGKINFTEQVSGKTAANYLWGNAAFALGLRIVCSFEQTSWFRLFYGLETGGITSELPVPSFDYVDIPKMSVDVCLQDEMERDLSREGFLCLTHRRFTTDCVFYGKQTAYQPKRHFNPSANANERLSSQATHMLCASRFAHYLKVIMRNKIGRFDNQKEIQAYLNRWIQMYVVGSEVLGNEKKLVYPLKEGRVEVVPKKFHPGHYNVIAYLKPHLQLEEATATVQLISELAPISAHNSAHSTI